MQEWLISLSVSHTVWVYIFIIFFACAEGPFLSMVFGVLIKLGYFDFKFVYLALMAGDALSDTILYYVGFFYGHSFIRKFGKIFDITEQNVEEMKRIFHKYKHSILFISKITNGLGFSLLTLITAGIAKIPFGRYLGVNFLGQFIWTGMLMAVGYFFGNLYIQINDIVGRIFIVLLFVSLLYIFIKSVKYLRIKYI